MKKLVLLLLLSSPAYAHNGEYPDLDCQDCTLDQRIEVASEVPMVQSESGKSTDVLDSYLIDQYKETRVVDNLSGIPGVETKNAGGISTVRIRGMRSYDTKWLYNGVPMKDPTEPQSSFTPFVDNLLNMGTTEVQVLKGVGSTIYGSEAMGGVVDIEPLDTPWSYQQEVGHEWKEALTSPYGSVVRLDSRESDNTSFNVGHKWEKVELWGLFIDASSPINNSPYIMANEVHTDEHDENNRSEERFVHGGAKVALGEFGQWTVSGSESRRRFVFLPNEDGSDFYSDGTFTGDSIYSDLRFSGNLGTIGWTYLRDWYKFETGEEEDEIDRYQNDFYVEKKIEIGKVDLLLGGRESLHESTKARLLFDVSAVYHVDKSLLVRIHTGSGYRAPSLYELNGAFLTDFGRFEIGNPELSPERSTSFDVGVQKQIGDLITLGATYFSNTVKNRIGFVGGNYGNMEGDYNPHGVEAYYEHFLFGCASARIAYTKTWAENLIDIGQNSFDLSLRVEKKKWNASVRARIRDKHTIELFDYDTFEVDRVKEDGSVVVDVTVGYKVKDNVEIYARAENLFGEDYEVGAYRQNGARVYGGVKVAL